MQQYEELDGRPRPDGQCVALVTKHPIRPLKKVKRKERIKTIQKGSIIYKASSPLRFCPELAYTTLKIEH
jgi:hypothetical protein